MPAHPKDAHASFGQLSWSDLAVDGQGRLHVCAEKDERVPVGAASPGDAVGWRFDRLQSDLRSWAASQEASMVKKPIEEEGSQTHSRNFRVNRRSRLKLILAKPWQSAALALGFAVGLVGCIYLIFNPGMVARSLSERASRQASTQAMQLLPSAAPRPAGDEELIRDPPAKAPASEAAATTVSKNASGTEQLLLSKPPAFEDQQLSLNAIEQAESSLDVETDALLLSALNWSDEESTKFANEADAVGVVDKAIEPDAAAERQSSSPEDGELQSSHDVDILAEVADIARQSQVQRSETTLEFSDSESQLAENSAAAGRQNNPLQHPPLQISTFPILQVVRLPRASVPRATQPSWRLRLVVSEGLSVQPNQPTMLTEDTIATWRITSDPTATAGTVGVDGDPNHAPPIEEPSLLSVVVQAIQSGTRGNALKWSVAAIPQQYPQIRLPMGQEFLDVLQSNLDTASFRAQAALDSLRSLTQARGLGSAARSQMSRQRSWLENQLETISHLRLASATAQKMDGWLDGQIKVQAAYYDGAVADSPPLLQFGDLQAWNEPEMPEPDDAPRSEKRSTAAVGE